MEMQRGQRLKLEAGQTSATLEVRCEVAGLSAADLRLLLVDANEKLIESGAIDAAGRQASDGVTPVGRPFGFDLDLGRVPARVARLVVVLAVTEKARARGLHAGALQSGRVTIHARGQLVCAYPFRSADFGQETALCLVEVYRKDGWRVTATGAGFLGGLPSVVARYGGRLEELDGNGITSRVGAGRQAGPSPDSSGGTPLISADHSGPVRLPTWYAGRKEPPVPAGLTPAVGLVLVERADGAATGTGFMIGPGGFFVTCAHVIEGARMVAFVPEGTREVRPAAVVKVDPDGDLALLHTVDRHGSTDWLLLTGADAAPDLGDNLGLLGYPLGGDLGINLTYSQGVINSLRKTENIPILQVDTGAAPGSSGGPVFRRSDGRVVGVLTSGLSARAGGMLVNFAVDARRLYQLGWVT